MKHKAIIFTLSCLILGLCSCKSTPVPKEIDINNRPKGYFLDYWIKEKIDIYKVPHHGTINCNSDKALEIYKPKIAVITNEDEYLKNNSTIYDDLKRANKDVKILLTEKHNSVIKISDNGNIVYREK